MFGEHFTRQRHTRRDIHETQYLEVRQGDWKAVPACELRILKHFRQIAQVECHNLGFVKPGGIDLRVGYYKAETAV
ncbi:hypothetical protein D3C86_2220250 [compost metagenome]